MLLPSVFGEDLFDEMMNMDDFFGNQSPLYGKRAKNLMKTDIREQESGYEIDIDLPGFKKEEIRLQLENGYLTVSAAKGLDRDEQTENGTYIRRERYAGSCSRSFYVGEAVSEEDVHARYEDGILKLAIPKKDEKELERKKYIAIEG